MRLLNIKVDRDELDIIIINIFPTQSRLKQICDCFLNESKQDVKQMGVSISRFGVDETS